LAVSRSLANMTLYLPELRRGIATLTEVPPRRAIKAFVTNLKPPNAEIVRKAVKSGWVDRETADRWLEELEGASR